VQDQLVYSYGITEDIPEGFKNEIVYGFDANEFGDRHYAHLFLSNGNLLINRKGYFYLAGGIGGFFNKSGYEQGQIQGSLNFISRQINTGNKRFRLFVRTNYMMGLKRFDIEQLTLRENDLIRGFTSKNAVGKQRLSIDLEYVLFLRREFQRFNMAVFGFADIGVIGSNKKLIFTENYYSGLGLGVRFHNENLVFKTFHLRLAFYPFHPDDMSFVGFILEEQSKRKFYSFEPTAPFPLRFE
jgi:hemolysin activation/secretion protein